MADARGTMLQDLIARVAKGDRHAFEALYQTTSARLNAICLSILRDRREAEEALEHTYIATWKTAKDFGHSGLSPMAWLVVAARDGAVARLTPTTPAATGDLSRPAEAVRAVFLQGLDLDAFAARAGIPTDAARQRLHEGLMELGAEDPDDLLAAEHVLGLAKGPEGRAASDPDFSGKPQVWQERFAAFADDLTPVMAPARARQRIRESLGHGAAPLSVDPLERAPWWRGTRGLVVLIVLAGAAAWYLWAA